MRRLKAKPLRSARQDLCSAALVFAVPVFLVLLFPFRSLTYVPSQPGRVSDTSYSFVKLDSGAQLSLINRIRSAWGTSSRSAMPRLGPKMPDIPTDLPPDTQAMSVLVRFEPVKSALSVDAADEPLFPPTVAEPAYPVMSAPQKKDGVDNVFTRNELLELPRLQGEIK